VLCILTPPLAAGKLHAASNSRDGKIIVSRNDFHADTHIPEENMMCLNYESKQYPMRTWLCDFALIFIWYHPCMHFELTPHSHHHKKRQLENDRIKNAVVERCLLNRETCVRR